MEHLERRDAGKWPSAATPATALHAGYVADHERSVTKREDFEIRMKDDELQWFILRNIHLRARPEDVVKSGSVYRNSQNKGFLCGVRGGGRGVRDFCRPARAVGGEGGDSTRGIARAVGREGGGSTRGIVDAIRRLSLSTPTTAGVQMRCPWPGCSKPIRNGPLTCQLCLVGARHGAGRPRYGCARGQCPGHFFPGVQEDL